MRFWDSSALLPLIVRETTSDKVAELLQDDSAVSVWWGTWIECSVSVSRLRREGKLSEQNEGQARTRLDRLATGWNEVPPTNNLRTLASLLSRDHPLKAADALQLAAALRWCEGDTIGAGLVCLDNQLRRAASDEGFDVLPEESV